MQAGTDTVRRPSGLALRNAAASVAVVVLASAAYAALPSSRAQLQQLHRLPGSAFTGGAFLVAAATAYSAALIVWFLRTGGEGESKSLLFFAVLARWARRPRSIWHERLSQADRVAVLATLLKMFFGPLMVMSLMSFCMAAWANGQGIVAATRAATAGAAPDLGLPVLRELFDRHGFWFLIQVILFVDVAIFTVGYLVEVPRLRNTIRSVDPTWLGWAAALLCYPPFNSLTVRILGSQNADFPRFDNPTVHLALNLLLLALMAVYASASVALGLKASNLTHRGIVARGPYALVRHPAYVCKNLAWWIGALPLVSLAFEHSLFAGLQALASVLGWTLLYVLRALTEEDHLRSVDAEYAAYAARVRWRFVPGVV